jgi:uncharacterized protein YggE
MKARLLALIALPLALQAQTAPRDSVISVNASRTTRMMADRATFYVTIEGTAETANDALARVDTKVKAVSEALKAYGNRVTAEAAIGYGVGPTPAPQGYPGNASPPSNLARSVIRVNLNGGVDQLSRVISVALGAGASNTSPAQFEASGVDAARRARIAELVATARADAESLAAALGGKLGALVDVSTTGGQSFQQQPTLAFDQRYGPGQTYAPEVQISTNVTVRYRLIR